MGNKCSVVGDAESVLIGYRDAQGTDLAAAQQAGMKEQDVGNIEGGGWRKLELDRPSSTFGNDARLGMEVGRPGDEREQATLAAEVCVVVVVVRTNEGGGTRSWSAFCRTRIKRFKTPLRCSHLGVAGEIREAAHAAAHAAKPLWWSDWLTGPLKI